MTRFPLALYKIMDIGFRHDGPLQGLIEHGKKPEELLWPLVLELQHDHEQ